MSTSIGKGRPSTQSGSSKNNRAPSTKREVSGGLFQMFGGKQIQQFKRSFDLLDVDGDGKIAETDLRETLINLGQTPSQSYIDSFFTPSSLSTSSNTPTPPRSLTFHQYLHLLSHHLSSLSPAEELIEAFACFDEDDKGWVGVGEMKMWMEGLGKGGGGGKEIDRLLNGPFTDSRGRFNYVEWARTVNVNDVGEGEVGAGAADGL